MKVPKRRALEVRQVVRKSDFQGGRGVEEEDIVGVSGVVAGRGTLCWVWLSEQA